MEKPAVRVFTPERFQVKAKGRVSKREHVDHIWLEQMTEGKLYSEQ